MCDDSGTGCHSLLVYLNWGISGREVCKRALEVRDLQAARNQLLPRWCRVIRSYKADYESVCANQPHLNLRWYPRQGPSLQYLSLSLSSKIIKKPLVFLTTICELRRNSKLFWFLPNMNLTLILVDVRYRCIRWHPSTPVLVIVGVRLVKWIWCRVLIRNVKHFYKLNSVLYECK